MHHQVLLAAWDAYTKLPTAENTILSVGHNKLISLRKKGLQMTRAFAALFYSTFFAAVRQPLLLSSAKRCRVFLPRCRGPPLLKSKVFTLISEEQEAKRMGFNYAKEKNQFDENWKKLQQEYEDAGMNPYGKQSSSGF